MEGGTRQREVACVALGREREGGRERGREGEREGGRFVSIEGGGLRMP